MDAFAATSSSELASVISDETGTGALVFANTPTLVTPAIGAATGTSLSLSSNDLNVGSQSAGLRTTDDYTNPIAVFSIDADDDYAQLVVKNTGNGVNSSSDIIAYSDNGNDTAGWIDMGITSSAFADESFTITQENDGYIFMEAPETTQATITNKALSDNVATITTSANHTFTTGKQVTIAGVDATFNGLYTITGTTDTTFTYAKNASNVSSTAVSPTGTANQHTGNGDLVLATGSMGAQNRIVFAAGGLSSDNTQMTITPNESVRIVIDTESTSPSTGALIVDGGVGIQGDVNIQGNITFGGEGTSLTTENLSVTDPLIFVGDGNTTDAVDMGLITEYTEASTTKYAGIVRDASDGVFKLFEDATTKPTSTVNFAEAGLGFGDLRVDEITAASAVLTNVTIGSVDQTEIAHLNGVTSGIQAQLDDKSTASKTETLTNKTITSPVVTGLALNDSSIVFEGSSADDNETTLTVTNPTADRTITIPDATGTVALTNNKLDAFAATTSAELASVLTDETGTGVVVYSNTPTLVTPELGAATGTSLNLSGSVTAASVTLTDALIGTALATASDSATTIDSWSATTYSSAKYLVQMKKGTDIEVIEVLVTVDGSNNVYLTEYADVISNAVLGTTNAVYSGGNVLLQVTGTTADTSVKVHKVYIEA